MYLKCKKKKTLPIIIKTIVIIAQCLLSDTEVNAVHN